MDLTHADVSREAHKGWQFADRFLQSGEPCGNPRARQSLALLKSTEGAHIAQDALEIVPATDAAIGFGVRRIQRHPQLVETR